MTRPARPITMRTRNTRLASTPPQPVGQPKRPTAPVKLGDEIRLGDAAFINSFHAIHEHWQTQGRQLRTQGLMNQKRIRRHRDKAGGLCPDQADFRIPQFCWRLRDLDRLTQRLAKCLIGRIAIDKFECSVRIAKQ